MKIAAAVLLLVACGRRTAHDGTTDAATQDAPSDAVAMIDATTDDAAAALAPLAIFGEWQRDTEPYRGMRIEIRAEAPGVATVTRPSVVDDRDPRKRELACQESLWKKGDVYVSDGTIVVRDWGLVGGVCRHQDTRAPAQLTLGEHGLSLLIAVKRGKTVVQTWTRVERPL